MQKKKVYAVSTAHLDTVWRWDLRKTIEEYLPDTLRKNFDLIERYPDYCFNFEGAFRYQLIEEYYPLAFGEIQNLVKRGNWYPAGACYENGDVNIPSPEALFRNILLGNRYFQEKFGVQSKDIFLPDCFGFGQALPSVMKYAGLLGFTTQKLSWGSAYGVPFTLGYWQGVDGSRVLACPNARSYRSKFSGDLRGEVSVIDDVAKNAFEGGLPYAQHLYGTGDVGGAPTEESVQNVCASAAENGQKDFDVISAQSDQIFKDIDALPDSDKDRLPVWNNELLMTSHGAGGYTARAMGKRLKTADLQILAGLYDDLGLPADVIYLLVCHCVTRSEERYGPGRRPTLRQIEKEGYHWAQRGLFDQESASRYLRDWNVRRSAMSRYMQVLGLGDRRPVESEERYIADWMDKGFPPETVALAYDKTVFYKKELNWRYLNGILRRWHENGWHTEEEVRQSDSRKPSRREEKKDDSRMEKYMKW